MTNTQTTAPLPLRSGSWAVDHDHSRVGFTIRHLGVAKVRGQFTDFAADVVVGATPEESSVTATVQLASVDTGNAERDTHIQADDIVDVATRPAMSFASTAITGSDDRWTVVGDLTIGDVAKPLTLDLEIGGVADFPFGGPRHAGIEATGELRRSDYGIAPGFPAPVLGETVKIELDLELLEPEG